MLVDIIGGAVPFLLAIRFPRPPTQVLCQVEVIARASARSSRYIRALRYLKFHRALMTSLIVNSLRTLKITIIHQILARDA